MGIWTFSPQARWPHRGHGSPHRTGGHGRSPESTTHLLKCPHGGKMAAHKKSVHREHGQPRGEMCKYTTQPCHLMAPEFHRQRKSLQWVYAISEVSESQWRALAICLRFSSVPFSEIPSHCHYVTLWTRALGSTFQYSDDYFYGFWIISLF